MLSTKEKYEKYKPKKFFGQNFLVDDNIAKKIVAALNIQQDDTIVEIGPGLGSLTKFLVQENCNLNAIEIDNSISIELKEKFPGLNIFNEDFLETDLKNFFNKRKIKIVGNIPYNITSQILFKLFDNRNIIECAVIMMQKEVATRLTAKPKTKDYGILAVNTQIFSTPKKLLNVPPTAFFPKPKVDSTVMSFTFDNEFELSGNVEEFREFLRAAFSKRRKTLRNSLKDFFTKHKVDISKIKSNLGNRPETLTTKEFTHLYFEILNTKNTSPQ